MKAFYRPLSYLISVVSGVVAGAAFERLWKTLSGDPVVPQPVSARHGTGKVLAAAALRGLVFGVVTAAFDRAGAKGFARLTDIEPDNAA